MSASPTSGETTTALERLTDSFVDKDPSTPTGTLEGGQETPPLSLHAREVSAASPLRSRPRPGDTGRLPIGRTAWRRKTVRKRLRPGPARRSHRPRRLAAEKRPFLWLEEVEGRRPSPGRRIRTRSRRPVREGQAVKPIYDRTMQILDSQERIPTEPRGDTVYNFWQDKDHPRGIWRRGLSRRTGRRRRMGDGDRSRRDEKRRIPWRGRGELPRPERVSDVSMSRGGSDAAVYRDST